MSNNRKRPLIPPGNKPRRDVTQQTPEEFQRATLRRRETAKPIDNFLVDGDTGMVYVSSSRTQAGLALLEEETISIPFAGFIEAAAAFMRITITPAAMGLVPDDGGANGEPH